MGYAKGGCGRLLRLTFMYVDNGVAGGEGASASYILLKYMQNSYKRDNIPPIFVTENEMTPTIKKLRNSDVSSASKRQVAKLNSNPNYLAPIHTPEIRRRIALQNYSSHTSGLSPTFSHSMSTDATHFVTKLSINNALFEDINMSFSATRMNTTVGGATVSSMYWRDG